MFVSRGFSPSRSLSLPAAGSVLEEILTRRTIVVDLGEFLSVRPQCRPLLFILSERERERQHDFLRRHSAVLFAHLVTVVGESSASIDTGNSLSFRFLSSSS